MRPLLCALALLWASAALFAQPADSLPARPPADTLFVIPAGPVAGSFTPAARIAVLDTIAGWAHITLFMDVVGNGIQSTTRALKIEENAKIPPEKFGVPAGFQVNQSGL